jgi:hypothetical protein
LDFNEILQNAKDTLQRWYLRAEEKYYALCDTLDQRYHVPVYRYWVNPLESRGIPSFPVALGVLVLLFAIIVWAVVSALVPAAAELRVTVFSESGERLQGAHVEVRDDEGEVLAFADTNAAGVAVLAGVPIEPLVVRVEKEGYSVAEELLDPAQQKTLSLTLTPLPVATPEPAPESVFIPTPIPVTEAPPSRPLEAEADQKSKLTVAVKEKGTGKALLSAQVKVLNALTDVSLGEDEALSGVATFENLVVGTQAYLVVRADGFATFEGKQKSFSLRPVTAQIVELERAGSDAFVTTVVKTVESNATAAPAAGNASNATPAPAITGAPVSARVWILSLDQTVVNETDSTGEVSFLLLRNRQLHALAYREGFLPSRQYFLSGADVTLPMRRSTSLNAGSLKVRVRNLQNQTVNNATVVLYTSFLEFLMGPRRTVGGETTFRDLPRGEGVVVRASFNETVAEAEVPIAASNQTVDLVLEPIREQLTAVATTAGTNDTIPGAYFEFWQRGVNVTSCTQNSTVECRASLYVGFPITVKAFAEGFLPNARIETLYTGEPRRVILPLVRVPPSGIVVEGPRVKDLNGEEVSFYPANAPYNFEYTVSAAPGVEQTSLYVRVGSELAANQGPAAIYGMNRQDLAASIVQLIGSATHSPSTCNASNLTSHASNPNYFSGYQKWVEVRLRGSGPFVVSIRVQGFPWPRADNLSVYHRGWTRTTGFNATPFYNRTPPDADLGFNFSSATKPFCAANATRTVLYWNCGMLGGFACLGDPVCHPKLQKRGGSCLNPEVCGPNLELCTGRTACCRFGDALLCQEGCQTPVTCNPACQIGAYCDASGTFPTCRDCTPEAVNASACLADCGGENELCCDVSLGAAGAGCNAGLLCGGWKKSESCSSAGVAVGIGAGNLAEANCRQLTLAVNPLSGKGSVRFDIDQRCSGLTWSVTDSSGSTAAAQCFNLAQGFLDYNGKASTQCGFSVDSTGRVVETKYKFTYNCPNYNEAFTDIDVTIVDESLRISRIYEPVQITARGGVCINQDQAWKYRRPITLENTAGEALVGYPVLLEFDSRPMVQLAKANADGSDFRVVTAGGIELPFYLDPSTMGSEKTRLWLPADVDANANRSDLYLYYGNRLASLPPQWDLPLSTASTNSEWQFARFDAWERRCADVPQCASLEPALPRPPAAGTNKTCTVTNAEACGQDCTTIFAQPYCTPRTCVVTRGDLCGIFSGSSVAFYQVFPVPSGVVSLVHSGSVDFKPEEARFTLYAGGQSIWNYSGTGQESFTNVQVNGNLGNRLVYALEMLHPDFMQEENRDTFIADAKPSLARVTQLRVRLARPASASLGEEEAPPAPQPPAS